ncbi:hypothetical protein [Teredinibacter turnerae]|uniref:hypothetical protein n=1 Tax=Teredinibacter turnerae TaxID=2426 RepID=UPI000371D8F3|nr:hypothetical protein [Teredinibacter turnerae]
MKTHFYLVYIRNTIAPIDQALINYRSDIEQHSEPDTFGLIDQYEQFLGIGFTVCQTFLSCVHHGKNKGAKFKKGPFHSSGKSYAQIANACANYWKHNDEWDKANLSNQSKSTIAVFKDLSVDVWGAYPLSEMFYALLGENGSFMELLNHLNSWSNEVE